MLIVEDDAAIADVLSTLLVGDGFAVTVVGDGLAALARVAADPPDLILLDLMIPGLNGLEVCRRIRATSIVPIIIVSARATDADKVLGLEAGADDYLTKPFLLRELRARIHAVLRRSAR
jgi:two-component system response regulator RegX3